MPHVDSLLQLAHREGANELRLGTDRAPAMFAMGAQRRLAIPKTSADTLRHLLGELITPEVEAHLRESHKSESSHEVPAIGTFKVTITPRGDGSDGLDAIFLLTPRERVAPPGDTKRDEPPRRALAAPAAPFANTEGDRQTSNGSPPNESHSHERSVATSETEQLGSPSPDLIRLLLRALAMRASDLHVATGEAPSVRVDGSLGMLSEEGALNVEELVGSLIDRRGRDQLVEGRSVDLALDLPSVSFAGYRAEPPRDNESRAPRVRGNAYRTSRGLAAAFRLLPPEAPSLDAIAQPVPLGDLPLLPNGLVIVCGPTGSGKSTTLAALAQDALRARSILLVTLEDPIEYALVGGPSRNGRGRSLVRQRQIGRDARDFTAGLRDALREDPDVILVGEMRDAESISLALTAAETGHLVLTTLHSRGAASAIERIVDVYPQGRHDQVRSQLADSLRAVVAQRLLPRAHGEGRALALEVLRVNAGVANGLRDGKIANVVSAMQSGKRDGMITLERSLADLVKRGEVSGEDARAAANDKDSLATYLQSVG